MKRAAAYAILLSVLALVAHAQEARPLADDPALEERLMKLSQELRCLVCQNETLAESRADLAEDLRREIREQMRQGKTDKQIIAFLTERYGQFVLYRPPVQPSTYLLWFGPFVALLLGLLLLFRYVRQRHELIIEAPLSGEEHRRARELLSGPEPKKEKA